MYRQYEKNLNFAISMWITFTCIQTPAYHALGILVKDLLTIRQAEFDNIQTFFSEKNEKLLRILRDGKKLDGKFFQFFYFPSSQTLAPIIFCWCRWGSVWRV
jgi:hypothetical protein